MGLIEDTPISVHNRNRSVHAGFLGQLQSALVDRARPRDEIRLPLRGSRRRAIQPNDIRERQKRSRRRQHCNPRRRKPRLRRNQLPIRWRGHGELNSDLCVDSAATYP